MVFVSPHSKQLAAMKIQPKVRGAWLVSPAAFPIMALLSVLLSPTAQSVCGAGSNGSHLRDEWFGHHHHRHRTTESAHSDYRRALRRLCDRGQQWVLHGLGQPSRESGQCPVRDGDQFDLHRRHPPTASHSPSRRMPFAISRCDWRT